MNDEIRIYHVDDPNDAPERRLSGYPTINSFLPKSLPTYVIPPVANSLMTLMQYHWYSAYQQGVATAQKQQQVQAQHQHHHQHQYQHQAHQQQQQHHQHQLHNQHLTHLASSSSCSPSSSAVGLSSSAPSSSPSGSLAGSSAASPVTSTTPASNPHSLNRVDGAIDERQPQQQQKHVHIKKPLNPFMIYMQRRRPEIVKQGIIKESAAINQMLGQQWRKLTKEEQEPYYKLAEQEKILHAQKYPGWSARDNYANQKKKKKLKLKSISLNGLDQSDKKCRARFGLNSMASWCKPCRRKKKCIYSQPSHKSDSHSYNNLHQNHHHPLQHNNLTHHYEPNHHHHYHGVTHIID